MSPIQDLTDSPRSYIKLGQIRKGERDAKGVPHDLDYFRVTFMNHPKRNEIEKAFKQAYGEKPTSLDVKFAFGSVHEVFDANYECYKQGGLYFKAGSSAERGVYWIFYRDPDTAEIEISNGMARTNAGGDLLSRPIDLAKPLYITKDDKGKDVPHFFGTVGRLEVVIPQVAEVAVGYFEFRPESPRDIRNVSVELGTYEFMASQFGKSLLGVPFKLFRREETVTKKIGTKLTQGPSWVVHIEADSEWNTKALSLIGQMALPDIIEGEVQEIVPNSTVTKSLSATVEKPAETAPAVNPDPDDALILTLGMWAVDFAASTWNVGKGEAAKQISEKIGSKKISKRDFKRIVDPFPEE